MESEVLTYLHVVTTVDNSGNSLFSDPAVYPSFILDDQPGDRALKYCYTRNSLTSFSVTLQLQARPEDLSKAQWFGELCLLLCHPLYFAYNHKHIIGITGANQPGDQQFLIRLDDELKKQGFNDLLFYSLSENVPGANGNSFVLNTTSLHGDSLQQQLLRADFRNHGLNRFIVHRNDTETSQLVREWKMAEKELMRNDPGLYQMAKQLQTASSEAQGYRILIESLSEDLGSKTAYLDFILNRYNESEENGTNLNELMKLKKFYHNEYEILPLWYKRFGHIIKVLTGKRTFKSLFNNNVKKYKG